MYRFIYPTKDAYIYELNTNDEKNFGGDDNLVLKKDIDGNTLFEFSGFHGMESLSIYIMKLYHIKKNGETTENIYYIIRDKINIIWMI